MSETMILNVQCLTNHAFGPDYIRTGTLMPNTTRHNIVKKYLMDLQKMYGNRIIWMPVLGNVILYRNTVHLHCL